LSLEYIYVAREWVFVQNCVRGDGIVVTWVRRQFRRGLDHFYKCDRSLFEVLGSFKRYAEFCIVA
jgi:hypothetical protein